MNKSAAILFMLLMIFSPLFAQNDTLYVLFTANINGALENCDCGKEPLGGVGRIKTFIDQWKEQYPNTIAIDGGDYYNSYPHIELNTAMARAQKMLDYDILLSGDQAFIEGKSFYSDVMNYQNSRLLISNMKGEVKRTYSFKRGQTEIEVGSYLSEAAFEFITKPEFITLLDFNRTFKNSETTDQTLRIMVLHGFAEEAQEIAQNFPWIDLILLAHSQERNLENSYGTSIISVGKGGEYVGVITVLAKQVQWEISVEFRKINEKIPVDPQIQTIIDEYICLVRE
jgi:2',3'-cyclic-nucleotide 2'-phosphodiesterase (5'-nucleotidase family)